MSNTDLVIMFTRMEGKMDVFLSQQSAMGTLNADHETRLRLMADKIAVLEARPCVTPMKLFTTVSSASLLIIAIITLIYNFIK